jgi:hypothetical protein
MIKDLLLRIGDYLLAHEILIFLAEPREIAASNEHIFT